MLVQNCRTPNVTTNAGDACLGAAQPEQNSEARSVDVTYDRIYYVVAKNEGKAASQYDSDITLDGPLRTEPTDFSKSLSYPV
jgi:hypothetical protein